MSDNIVLVASKPISNYILAAKRVSENSKEIILKARGKNINTLVNLAEILKREGFKQGNIRTDTTSFKPKDSDKDILVSEMEISLNK